MDQAVLEVSDRNVYDSLSHGPDRAVTRNGTMDPRMGTSSKSLCDTCGEPLKACNGHFGQVKLALPVFHIGYLRFVVELLHCICKDCGKVLLAEDDRRKHLRSLRRPILDNLQRSQICKKVATDCRKCKKCPYCGAVNGPVRKVAGHPLKIVHLKFDHINKSTAKTKIIPHSKTMFDESFNAAKETNPEVERHVKRAVDDLNPLRVLNLFKRLSNTDCELLGMDPKEGRPEMFIWQYIPAPPVSIRPSVKQETATTEDDITNKLGDIVFMNSIIRTQLKACSQPIQTVMDQWEFLQIQIAIYINSDVPGLNRQDFGKPMRGFCQRLKGKQGRFRGNLSGKRVDFSGRTVISPDPNLGVDEVAIPVKVASNLTYPERVYEHNRPKLQARVRNGSKWPGANYIIKTSEEGRQIKVDTLERIQRRLDEKIAHEEREGLPKHQRTKRLAKTKIEEAADNLKIGDTVERHLEDGDIVLFNRQPSLHKLSILSHRAKIRPWRTFRLNECVCNPYNADFDGDEMNLHVPQTEEARVEAIELMGVKHNLATPKNGTPIIAAIQDFITGAYLLSSKDNFYGRRQFAQICGYMFNGEKITDHDTLKQHNFELPPPTILKPQELWTGKQIFNVLMRPYGASKVLVNLDAACKAFNKGAAVGRPPEYPSDDKYGSNDDNFLVIRNSEVLCGRMDKATVGDGKKDSVFSVMLREYGPDSAVQGMNRLARLSGRWLSEQGFTIGFGDVSPTDALKEEKARLIDAAYTECNALIEKYVTGKLGRDAGCGEEQTLENRVTGVLNQVRQDTANAAIRALSKRNAPILMATAGSKGSSNNVAQMIMSVGQQVIGLKRVQDGFQDRTLPHFPKNSKAPKSKGFVANSFYSGLEPSEFIFHAMSGREGLVDTAVKTAETGYMSRRLMKSLEDLSAQYDTTVRNSTGSIVQFRFGDDGLDPTDMEGDAKPVDFERTFRHAVMSTWNNDEEGMRPMEVVRIAHNLLERERSRYPRRNAEGKNSGYRNRHRLAIDHEESVRHFLDELETFIMAKANVLLDHPRIKSAKISRPALDKFFQLCTTKYEKSKVQPGHAVGAVGAQSIGEPGTQMTLKTFHFAGVAGMSITQGVPRIKEVINASRLISTPVITCALENPESVDAAMFTKSRIEKTYLRDVVSSVHERWSSKRAELKLEINRKVINDLRLDIIPEDIVQGLVRTKALHINKEDCRIRHHPVTHEQAIVILVPNPCAPIEFDVFGKGSKLKPAAAARAKKVGASEDFYVYIQNLKRGIVNAAVKGHPDASRAVIKRDSTPNKKGIEELSVLVEGYGLKACMTTEGVNAAHTTTNSVIETREVLGIEAARTTIVKEIQAVMAGMDIDPRHLQLLADVMTYKGDVLGITRFGLAKMRDSVLQLASFEKTPDHLFEAAWRMKKDGIEGVSECIIMGQSVKIGTGASRVVRRLGIDKGEISELHGGAGFEELFH